MITFFIALALLLVGYLTYGKVVERIFEPDDRPTPAVSMADGVNAESSSKATTSRS